MLASASHLARPSAHRLTRSPGCRAHGRSSPGWCRQCWQVGRLPPGCHGGRQPGPAQVRCFCREKFSFHWLASSPPTTCPPVASLQGSVWPHPLHCHRCGAGVQCADEWRPPDKRAECRCRDDMVGHPEVRSSDSSGAAPMAMLWRLQQRSSEPSCCASRRLRRIFFAAALLTPLRFCCLPAVAICLSSLPDRTRRQGPAPSAPPSTWSASTSSQWGCAPGRAYFNWRHRVQQQEQLLHCCSEEAVCSWCPLISVLDCPCIPANCRRG